MYKKTKAFQTLAARAGAFLLRAALGLALSGAGLGAACACRQPPPPMPSASHTSPDTTAVPYDFDRPDAVFELPRALREISGLTVLDEHRLGAIQDETGTLFILDAQTGTVTARKKFGKDGDYEGLERVGRRVFVLRSDGTLFEIADWRASKLKVTRHKTRLSSKYDTEGLGYDAARRRLLIACKEYAGKRLKHHRAVYAFDLTTNALLEAPVFTIPTKEMPAPSGESALNRRLRDLFGSVFDMSDFKPSALAVHPVTGRVYVLSSVRKVLLVLTPEGAISDVWALPKKRFPQPEGLTFLPDGTLFVSNEGGGRKATLLRFAYHPGAGDTGP
ncbi:SdiA-regulated domain-containing protein [Rhodocaloribacter sp.]